MLMIINRKFSKASQVLQTVKKEKTTQCVLHLLLNRNAFEWDLNGKITVAYNGYSISAGV